MAYEGFRSIEINGFKSIRDVAVGLRPINVLIGANGSGKSNFLEAFVFLAEVIEGRREQFVQVNGGANAILHYGSKITTQISICLSAFNGYNIETHQSFADGDALAGGIASGGFAFSGPSWRRYQFHDTGRYSSMKTTNQIDDNRFLRADGRNLAAFLYRLRQTHFHSYDAIRRTVQRVAPYFVDFQLVPVAQRPDTIKLEWLHKNLDGYFNASSFSDGTLRFVALATLLLQPQELCPSVILIDEPELGLHPFAITLLASLIRQVSVDTQVIVATQSPLLLDYFGPEDVLVADRVDGATTIERLNAERLAEWLEDYSLGQLWGKGELGGRLVRE